MKFGRFHKFKLVRFLHKCRLHLNKKNGCGQTSVGNPVEIFKQTLTDIIYMFCSQEELYELFRPFGVVDVKMMNQSTMRRR